MTPEEKRARHREYTRKWRAANPERARRKGREEARRRRERDPEKYRAKEREWNRLHPGAEYACKQKRLRDKSRWRRYLFLLSRRNARRRGIDFTISETDLSIPERCPVFHTDFTQPLGECRDTAPSIDRIDSRIGYVPGNVHVISYRANRIKNDATAAELRAIADYIDSVTRLSA